MKGVERLVEAIGKKGVAGVVCSGLAYLGGGLSRHKGLLAVVLIAGGVGVARGGLLAEIHWPQWPQNSSTGRKIDWHKGEDTAPAYKAGDRREMDRLVADNRGKESEPKPQETRARKSARFSECDRCQKYYDTFYQQMHSAGDGQILYKDSFRTFVIKGTGEGRVALYVLGNDEPVFTPTKSVDSLLVTVATAIGNDGDILSKYIDHNSVASRGFYDEFLKWFEESSKAGS